MRKMISVVCLIIVAICLGLSMFNVVFEKHERTDEKRHETFVQEKAGDTVVSDIVHKTQEDNERNRTIRKVVLILVGTSSAALGLVVLPARRSSGRV